MISLTEGFDNRYWLDCCAARSEEQAALFTVRAHVIVIFTQIF